MSGAALPGRCRSKRRECSAGHVLATDGPPAACLWNPHGTGRVRATNPQHRKKMSRKTRLAKPKPRRGTTERRERPGRLPVSVQWGMLRGHQACTGREVAACSGRICKTGRSREPNHTGSRDGPKPPQSEARGRFPRQTPTSAAASRPQRVIVEACCAARGLAHMAAGSFRARGPGRNHISGA